MPLYEYRCHKCGQVFEALQKFSDEPLETHVACGGVVERLLSAPAFQFKGTGFYITDYGKKNGSNGSHERFDSNGTSAKTEAPSSKATESKPSASTAPAAKS